MNDADKIADLVKEVRKDISLGETETEDDATSKEGSDYLSDETLSEDASCSSGSEEELSHSGDSEEELSCSGDSDEELSCTGDSEKELSCSDVSEYEFSEGKYRRTGLERECSEEDSLQILTNQSSSEESVQKIDAADDR